jgi:CheY-like chemotaxis protein
MELPLAVDDSGPIALDADTPDVPVPAGLRVLVADDDPVNLLVAVHQLAQFAADVVEADDGEAAWAAAQAAEFDVMFIDVQMPGIDGLEVVRRVRALTKGQAHQPVVAVMTASATAADHLAAREAGADEFVAKPAALADIAVVLRRAGDRH